MKDGNAQTLKKSASNEAAWFQFLGLEDTGSEELRKMVAVISQWCTAFKDGRHPRWLSLLGVSGVGKTHCAARVWKWLQGAGMTDSDACECRPFLVRWPSFANDLREGRVWDVYRDMMRWPVLVLDDIGAAADSTGFITSKLVDLLLVRDGKWTIITSNLGFKDLGAIDPRVTDRMLRHGGLGYTMENRESFARWQRRNRK